jgi:hypothetical protein
MQLELRRARERGYRESRFLVETEHASLCDLKKLAADYWQSQIEYDALRAQLDTLTQTHVSRIQHLRAQILFRLGVE